MARTKTWAQKLAAGKPPHVAVLDKAFAGVPAGKRLFIASPQLLREKLAAIPAGETVDVAELRNSLAAEHGADATCPVTTSIFLRIVAEAALEEVAAGQQVHAVTPFWRVIDPKSPLAGKLTCGAEFIEMQRRMESPAARAA